MRTRRRPSRPGLLRALHNRSTGTAHALDFRAALYSGLVPSSTYNNVSKIPSVSFRRFTPCGRYLVGISRSYRELVLFRLESGGRRRLSPEAPPELDFERPAFRPRQPAPPSLDPWLMGQQGPDSLVGPAFAYAFPQNQPFHNNLPFASPMPTFSFAPPGAVVDNAMRRPQRAGLLSDLPIPLVGGIAPGPASPDPNPRAARNARTRQSEAERYSCSFSRFFTKLYEVPIALNEETLAPEFCLATPTARYLILASYLPREADNNELIGHLPQLPVIDEPSPAVSSTHVLERFTLHLLNVETGMVEDRFTLTNDFVELDGHSGVHMHGDVLCVLSIRYQVLHIIKVQENLGRFVHECQIGRMCRVDDDLEIARAREAENAYQRRKREEERKRAFSSAVGPAPQAEQLHFESHRGPSKRPRKSAAVGEEAALGDGVGVPGLPGGGASPPRETGLGRGKLKSGFYTGLMQRLLVYVYRRYYNEGNESFFYRVVGQYSLLVMLKAQFLDEDHLLIRLGSPERGGKASDVTNTTCFFVVYCISTTSILNLFENKSTEFLSVYERFRDVFIGDPAVSATLPPVQNNGDDLTTSRVRTRRVENSSRRNGSTWPHRDSASPRDGRSSSKRVRTELSALPVSCQMRNVSPYLDRGIFSYDIHRIPALDGTRPQCLKDLDTVKFVSVRSGALRFKLSPGDRSSDGGRRSRRSTGTEGGRQGHGHLSRKRKALYLFHPHYPFVISMDYNLTLPTTYNFHVYGFPE